ncbi:MAG: S1 RNA-binding domain-containing protein [Phycisphaerae bacterium]|nr:S1 RNA-binding domain-containing protein [Phycisphaerae bacterium]
MESPAHPSADPLALSSDADLERQVAEATAGMAETLLTSGPSAGASDGRDAFAPGSLVKGRVANVGSSDVLVDLGGKMLGVIPTAEFETPPAIGAEIEALVEGPDAKGGLLMLSHRKASAAAIWRDLAVGQVLEGRISGMNKGGLEVDISGVRAFIPSSQVSTRFMKDISELIGQAARVEVMKFDRAEQNLVVSRRKVLEREATERRANMLASLTPGQRTTGRVRSLTDYGAFVELAPGVDGLLHVSDMSWGRVQKPGDVVSVGQELEVEVLKVDGDAGKISLGLKQIKGNPWERVAERFAPQQRVTGRVARLADFGAFIELEEGIDGLLPVSEMSWTRRLRHPKEVVKEGDVVEVVVLAVDAEKRRISLGLKQLQPNPWDNIAERYPPDRLIPARVARITEFGAFIELEPGLDGLLHISEISEQRIKTVSEKLQVGQEVQVRVIRIDTEAKRISLSMKPYTAHEASPTAEAAKPAPKKPSKPRRGGLELDWAGVGLGSLDPSKYAR